MEKELGNLPLPPFLYSQMGYLQIHLPWMVESLQDMESLQDQANVILLKASTEQEKAVKQIQKMIGEIGKHGFFCLSFLPYLTLYGSMFIYFIYLFIKFVVQKFRAYILIFYSCRNKAQFQPFQIWLKF